MKNGDPIQMHACALSGASAQPNETFVILRIGVLEFFMPPADAQKLGRELRVAAAVAGSCGIDEPAHQERERARERQRAQELADEIVDFARTLARTQAADVLDGRSA